MSSVHLPPRTPEACDYAKRDWEDALHAMDKSIALAARGGVPYVPDSKARVTELPGGPLVAALYYPVNLTIAAVLEVMVAGYLVYKAGEVALCAISGASSTAGGTCRTDRDDPRRVD